MDPQVQRIPNLSQQDVDQLHRVEAGLQITADVSRADLLLCGLLSPDKTSPTTSTEPGSVEGTTAEKATIERAAVEKAIVLQHAMPKSIPSLYREETTGMIMTPEEQPLLFRVLKNGRGGRRKEEIVSRGAPVIQDIYPILNSDKNVIGALIIETNMIAHERQRRRNRNFRHALFWLQNMCMAGELTDAQSLSRFSLYDGIYLIDRNRSLTYLSGIGANMFRSIGLAVDVEGQHISELETIDDQMVSEVFSANHCIEERTESEDGRVWIRKALPLRMSATPFQFMRFHFPWFTIYANGDRTAVDAVLVLLHNATEAVQRQRELDVQSAIIQEVHHRVKNNLQTIAAVLRLQIRRSENTETQQHLSDAVNRILGMSVIHEFLSQGGNQLINLKDVFQRIGQQVTQVAVSPEQEVTIRVTGQNVRLPADQVTPAAMVVNELLLNAVEHGLADQPKGYIEIELRDQGASVQVNIWNSGNQLPPDFDPGKYQNLGLQIVRILVTDDLKGKLIIESVENVELENGQKEITSSVDTIVSDTPVSDTPVSDTSVSDTSVADTSISDKSVADSAVADGAVTDGSTNGTMRAADAKINLAAEHTPNGVHDRGMDADDSGSEGKTKVLIPYGTRAQVTFPKRSLKVD